VAHPDDETLWCGGYILTHPEFRWRIVTLCRASDTDREPRFREVLRHFGAAGEMADLDDGPEQTPLAAARLQGTITRLLAGSSFDLILTHGPDGEYTQHRRHAECCQSVIELWQAGSIGSRRLWLFAYEDGGRKYLPRVRADADRRDVLANEVWLEKRRIIMELYGFLPGSWEAQTAPREEGFWCFDSAQAAAQRAGRGVQQR
jgi:LmbE family N-acetylglucosaminyl deacetylase